MVSSLFLLLTAVIHVMLLDKQHLHGLTVLCHSISMFFMYIFCAIAHIVSIYPEWKGKEPRSGFCLSVGKFSMQLQFVGAISNIHKYIMPTCFSNFSNFVSLFLHDKFHLAFYHELRSLADVPVFRQAFLTPYMLIYYSNSV